MSGELLRLQAQRATEDPTRTTGDLEAFSQTLAHDLREPLRTISAFTELLIRNLELEGANGEIAHFIVDGVARMSALLDDLLSSAAPQHHREFPGFVDLECAATQAVQNLNAALSLSGAGVSIGALPRVRANKYDMIRVFQNLISNAVKYRKEEALKIHMSAELVGGGWVIRVRDNGIGIEQENHNRIFDRFARLHSGEIPGSGVGLAVCKNIVNGLGGAIWVESKFGEGSTFCFTVSAGQHAIDVNYA